MDNKSVIDEINVENLYKHVFNLEGIKHPIDTPDKLNEAADYIHSKLKEYGVSTREQKFTVDDFSGTFRNIEGVIGDENKPSFLLVNHYDTVYNSPGANDNAASIALMLEIARILAKKENIVPIRFLSTTLEEKNPAIELKMRKSAQKWDLIDDSFRYKTYQISTKMTDFHNSFWKFYHGGQTANKSISRSLKKLGKEIPDSIINHIKDLQEFYPEGTIIENLGAFGTIGSKMWVKEALSTGKKIKLMICTDELGTVRKKKYSQEIPSNANNDIFESYKVDWEGKKGDFIFISANQKANKFAQKLCMDCKLESIDLPYLCFLTQLNFEEMYRLFPDILGSDHKHFWRADIPGILISDTAGLRNPYKHSMEDTIDKVDFNQVAKISKVILTTLINSEI